MFINQFDFSSKAAEKKCLRINYALWNDASERFFSGSIKFHIQSDVDFNAPVEHFAKERNQKNVLNIEQIQLAEVWIR